METKGNSKSMARLARRLGYSNVEFIKARGLAGGQILMECLWKTNHIFSCLMKNEFTSECWKFFSCYSTL